MVISILRCIRLIHPLSLATDSNHFFRHSKVLCHAASLALFPPSPESIPPLLLDGMDGWMDGTESSNSSGTGRPSTPYRKSYIAVHPLSPIYTYITRHMNGHDSIFSGIYSKFNLSVIPNTHPMSQSEFEPHSSIVVQALSLVRAD